MPRIAVVGGGIAGLAAAWRLAESAGDHTPEVVLFESTDRVGGKLRTEEIAGHTVDVGAESVLARRPEATGLIDALGLPKVAPAQVGAQVWSRDHLHPMPRGSFMGVPADAQTLRGVLDDNEVARAAAERQVQVSADVSVGDLVEQAFGPAVVDRLVEPLLGGVYAGQARLLSAAACMPALYDVARRGGSLAEAVAKFAPPPAAADSPRPAVFASVRGGIGALPIAMADDLHDRGVDIRTGTVVHDVRREGAGWSVASRGWRDEVVEHVDAVVLATPAHATAKLLAGVDHAAAQELSSIDYASMVVITYAFPRAGMPELDGSGFLVPPVDGRDMKASTFTSVKWPWVAEEAPDLVFVRVSLGRHGEVQALQRSDADLARAGLADLSAALGAELPEPVETYVQRWGGGIPQYAVGHVDLVAAVRDSLADQPTLQLAGAAYDGVGIPACIASGYAAADALLGHFTSADEAIHTN